MGKINFRHYAEQGSKTNYGFYGIFGLVTFFIWCDLSFFGELAAEQANGYKVTNNATSRLSATIKLRMQDHFGHYIFLPFARWLDSTFKISKISFVTPNLITLIHFCLAMVCGRLVASVTLYVRQIGVALYEVRDMLDILDGVVYRAQSANHSYVSGWGTYGYLVDALADTIGGLFVMFGSIYRLNKYLPFKNPEDVVKLKSKFRNSDSESGEAHLLSEDSCSEEAEGFYALKRYSRQAVNLTILFFTFTVILRSGLWDHFNHGYHTLLSVERPDISPEKQREVLNYRSTWFSLWLWKTHSADAFMQCTLFAIGFGKLWRWLRFNMYAGVPNIVMVAMFCQFHLMQMRNILGVTE